MAALVVLRSVTEEPILFRSHVAVDLLWVSGGHAMWIAPAIERSEPDLLSDERTALEQWLDYHRATLLTKCAGLTAAQLKQRAVPPSRLSLLGLVRHMVEVERWWFRMHAAGEDVGFIYDPEAVGL